MWSGLDWQAWVTLGIVMVVIVALIREMARPEMIFLGALGLLLLFGILTPEDAFQGFANPAVIAVGSLFVVAAGVQNTGAFNFIDRLLFSNNATLSGTLARLMFTTATMSAFLNNTPIVAMLIPQVQTWSSKSGVPVGKLLIPLSYAAIVGGMTTLIGTSTNLLISGLMQNYGYEGLGLFDLTWAGLPAALCAILYILLVGHKLLPDRSKPIAVSSNELDNYFFEVRVAAASDLAGKTIEHAGLRSLREAYLVHLHRDHEVIPASPETTLTAGDVLTFLGNVSIMDTLLEHPNFERVVTEIDSDSQTSLPLFEAVVAPSSRLVGKTLRQVGFRNHFQGVVLGIQRRDTQVEGPLGNIPIKSGDLLLVEARRGFAKRWSGGSDFYLVAPRRSGIGKPQTKKAPLALLILVGLVVIAALEWAPIATTAFVGALAMVVTRCLPGWEARRAIELAILIVIACALGIGRAIETTGLAEAIANSIINSATMFGVIGVLAAVYVATAMLTELITNNAAAALMLGIGLAAARDLGAPPEAFAIAVAIAASASCLTPIGYQTNLMVMAAGGYRFSDYTKAGFGVALIVAIVSITSIWLIWL